MTGLAFDTSSIRPELMVEGRPRGSGLTLSGASLPRLKGWGLAPPNGSYYPATPLFKVFIDSLWDFVYGK